MSNNRLEQAREENRELRRLNELYHEALADIPALYLEWIVELRRECTTPSRVGEQLGVAVSGTPGERHGPRTNHQAQSELRREKAELTRRAVAGLGGDRGQGGTLETIVYGRSDRWGAASGTTTRRVPA